MSTAVAASIVALIAALALELTGRLAALGERLPASDEDALGYDRGFKVFARAARWTAPRLAAVAAAALVVAVAVDALT